MSDEITKNNDEDNTGVNELLDMKYYSYLAYLSYFLLIVNTVIASENVPLYGILLFLGTIFSFSTYIYLRKNDERFEFLFLKNFNIFSLLQICLLIPLLFYSFFIFIDFEISVLLILSPFWLVFFCSAKLFVSFGSFVLVSSWMISSLPALLPHFFAFSLYFVFSVALSVLCFSTFVFRLGVLSLGRCARLLVLGACLHGVAALRVPPAETRLTVYRRL